MNWPLVPCSSVGPRVDVRRSADRNSTTLAWLDGQHSFDTGVVPYGTDTHHGMLIVSNDDTIAWRSGFDTHPHRDMEIVTWVLDGSLVHQDSEGHSGLIYPNLAQRMSAGAGIRHSERNDAWRLNPDAAPEPAHLIQMWVLPDEAGITPSYQQLELEPSRLAGTFATIASGMSKHRNETAIRISNKYAALHGARLAPGESVTLPDAPFAHLYVARGSVTLEGTGPLDTGDAARLTRIGGQRVAAIDSAEVLVWEMHATLDART